MTDMINRRGFLKKTAATGIGLGMVGQLKPVYGAASPNNTITLAVLGTNSRGSSLAKTLVSLPGCEVTYICDPEDGALAKGIESVEMSGGKTPKGVKDFRKALEDKSLDGVVIAAPDHWHTPAALLALQAGKHVYVEKPCGHNPREGELLVEADEKYKDQVIVMGSQRRSWPGVIEIVRAIHDGLVGRAYYAQAWYYDDRGSIGHGKVASVPSSLDWELWQGPAPRRPYCDNVVHYKWHWFLHWGTGESCNNGTHEVDVCRWALGVDYPKRVTSTGGRYAFEDDWEFYDTQMASFEFPEGKSITWQGVSAAELQIHGDSRGVAVHGTEGSVVITDETHTVYDRSGVQIKQKNVRTGESDTGDPSTDPKKAHQWDFLQAIRTGKRPNAPIDEGHKSVLLCHMANIAERCGGAVDCDPKNGHIVDNKKAKKLWGREYKSGWKPKV